LNDKLYIRETRGRPLAPSRPPVGFALDG
jgi:hypothetical protein